MQLRLIPEIPGDFRGELLLPELATRSGSRSIAATDVTMPEAAVNENDSIPSVQDNIRTSRQFGVMQSET
jgi:hypothetical protein